MADGGGGLSSPSAFCSGRGLFLLAWQDPYQSFVVAMDNGLFCGDGRRGGDP
jgi:hypothetical protein